LKDGEWAWSLWDRIEIDIGDATLQALIDHFEEKYGENSVACVRVCCLAL
jgi:hypothetical protein